MPAFSTRAVAPTIRRRFRKLLRSRSMRRSTCGAYHVPRMALGAHHQRPAASPSAASLRRQPSAELHLSSSVRCHHLFALRCLSSEPSKYCAYRSAEFLHAERAFHAADGGESKRELELEIASAFGEAAFFGTIPADSHRSYRETPQRFHAVDMT